MSLASLLEQIEEETEKNCAIQDELTKAQKELVSVQYDMVFQKSKPEISEQYNDMMSQLSLENKEVIKETMDKINDLYSEYEQVENEMTGAKEKLNTLLDIQNNYQKELIQINKSKNIDTVFSQILAQEVALTQSQIKDIDDVLIMTRNQIKKTGTALAEQISIEESLENRGGGKVDTQNQIVNLDVEIGRIQEKTEKSANDMIAVQNWIADDEENYQQEMEKIEKLYGYKKLHEEMRKETMDTNKAINTNKSELEKIEQRLLTSEKRYKILQKLPKKKLITPEEFGEQADNRKDISYYYNDLKNLRKIVKETEESKKKELEQLRQDIKKLEQRVQIAKRSLHSSQEILKSVNQGQKDHIQYNRDKNADNEEEILQTINIIKTKIPVRTPKKSAIPRRATK